MGARSREAPCVCERGGVHAEDEFSPPTRKVTVIGGIVFNPWVNISVSALLTIALAWMTVWFWGLWTDVVAAPAYEDQGLDSAGALIGVVVVALVAVVLFVVTIWLVIWWARRGWKI